MGQPADGAAAVRAAGVRQHGLRAAAGDVPVSYTHLTLPTSDLV